MVAQILADKNGEEGSEPCTGNPKCHCQNVACGVFLQWCRTLKALIRTALPQDPLAIMGLLGLFVPFVILGIAIATGVIDISKGKL